MNVMERPPKENKNIWWFVGALILVIALVVIWVVWPRQSVSKNPEENLQPVTENNSATTSASFTNSLMPEIIDADHLWGDKNAKLALIVYEDLSKSFSGDLDQSLEQLKKDYNNNLKIAYRPFIVNGSISLQAAQAVECAFVKEKGWEFRQSLLEIVKSRSLLEEDFSLIANKLGLSEEEFTTCLSDQQKAIDLAAQSKDAAKYGVIGAPTLFIGDEMINGARPLNDFVDSANDKIEGLNTIIQRKLQ